MNDLAVFKNEEFGEVRTLQKDDEVWFVASDVCRALEIGNPSQALTRLEEDEKSTIISNEGATKGREINIISEAGLYNLVLGSRKPEAKAFKRWITHEVVPQIRKTGSYGVAKTPTEMLVLMAQELDKQSKAVLEVKEDVKRLESKIMTVPNEYYTVAGYANLKGKRIDVTRANQIGRYAANLSRKWGYEIGHVSDARYGTVNSYHMDILRDAFRGIK